MKHHNFILSALSICLSTSCATYWQVDRLEEQIDRLVQNTNRTTLTQIFGEQTSEITRKLESLNSEERDQLDTLLGSYERGARSIEEIRTSVLGVLGGGERQVASNRGIWVRDDAGQKLRAIARNTKIAKCRQISEDALPEPIRKRRSLSSYGWGIGELNGEEVLFPWELTISSFTMEIVENTARRTAEEFIKMGGDKAFQRPIKIQITTDASDGSLKISHGGDESEIFVTTQEQPQEQPQEESPQG